MKRGIPKYILSLALLIAAPVHAGGPLSVCSGIPGKYSGAGTVTLNYDQGNLGSRSKVQADALVTEAVSLWTNVGTATVTLARGSDLPVDVTTANYSTYGTNTSDGLNPVIYDTDGSIIDMLEGVGAKNDILGFAGSSWNSSTCQYIEGRAVINGFIAISDTKMKTVLAHEVGHLIGLDHTQLDSTQGLSSSSPSNYPLMYPIAYRGTVSLHEDDVAAVSALYPDTNLSSVYGQLTGTFTQVAGTPIRGANLWAEETTSHQLFSIVSDYLEQNTGYFKLLLPAGTYTLHAEAVQTNFTGGSSVGPYSELSSDSSFQSPLYVGGVAMTPVTLGNATPTQIAIIAGCAATAGFKLDGSGTVSGNCGSTCSYSLSPISQTAAATGLSGTITVSSTSGCAWTAVSNANWVAVTSGASGSGNGIVVYSVAANTSSSSRTGTLTIAGQTFTVTQTGAGGGTTGSLTTTFAGGLSQSGNMFDVKALNGNVTINRFDLNLQATAGTLVTVRAYYKTGSYTGLELTSSAWTLFGTYSVTSAGSGSPSSMPMDNLLLTSSQTYGIYLTTTDGSSFVYTTGANTYANADIQVTLGAGIAYPFATAFTPRTWNGTIYYSAGGTSATVPGAPTMVSATAGNGSATLAFTAPSSNGGAAISGYKATCGTTTVSGASSPITVTPLTNGTTYACTVKASNSVGDSAPSASLNVTPFAPITPSGAPTLTSATPSYASATLSFTAPTSTGGATITSYTATCTASGQPTRSGIGGSSPLIVTRLDSGVAYSCAVTATNSAGASAASNAISVTPTDIASATTVLEMPWFTKASGYISRFVLLNTGNSAATYNITVLTEDGNTVALNANYVSGSIAAGSQLVINVDDLVSSFSVGQRAMAIITSSAPTGTLSGIYNLVQPTTGAISNVSLLRGQDFVSISSVLLAPWFSTASGYSSAFILSNAGNIDTPATLSFLAPTGTTVTPLISTLTVPAQGQRIVDTSTLATLTGGTAGAVVFYPDAPEGRIKGTYKIVNIANGTASCTELVNPQTTSGSTTRLVAPWFSTAAGYSSNFILTNRGSSAAAYTIAVQTETGNTATTGTLTGAIPANGQVILPASSVVSGFTAATRASAIFDVTGSPAVIDGAYKIVGATGAISTTILARTDTSGSSTTTLKLPWFSGAAGYVSRFVLVNLGTTAATFTIQIFPESGNAVTQILTSGTIPARGQLVLPVSDVISGFSGATRAAAVFTVSAPTADIDGLYNIVNPASGTISNTMMGK